MAALLVLGVGASFLTSHRNLGQNPAYLDRAIVAIFRPVAVFFNGVVSSIEGFVDDVFLAYRAAGDNRDLKSRLELLELENQHLRVELASHQEDTDFARRYSMLRREFVRARILAFDPFTQSKTLLIDQGRVHGVRADTVVMGPGGLVGRVAQVFDQTSKVLLLIDDDFAVDVVSTRSGFRALVKGLSTSELAASRYPFLSQVEYFQNAVEMQVGDSLVTSGVSKIFPAGIPVGKLTSLSSMDAGLFGRAIVAPSVDFARLKSVYLLQEKHD